MVVTPESLGLGNLDPFLNTEEVGVRPIDEDIVEELGFAFRQDQTLIKIVMPFLIVRIGPKPDLAPDGHPIESPQAEVEGGGEFQLEPLDLMVLKENPRLLIVKEETELIG